MREIRGKKFIFNQALCGIKGGLFCGGRDGPAYRGQVGLLTDIPTFIRVPVHCHDALPDPQASAGA